MAIPLQHDRELKAVLLPSTAEKEHRAEEWDCTGSCLHCHRSYEGKIKDLLSSGGLVLLICCRAVMLLFHSE